MEELGDLYYATSNYAAADRQYEEALRHVEHDQPRIRARLLLARAEVARENLDRDNAREGATQAIRFFEMTGDALGVAQAHRLLGRLAFLEGAFRDALDESMLALEILPAGSDSRFLGRLSIDIGNAFALLGEEVRSVAVEWYERAVGRLKAARDWAELARALHNLGVAVGGAPPEDGLEYLARARESAERAHDCAVRRTDPPVGGRDADRSSASSRTPTATTSRPDVFSSGWTTPSARARSPSTVA